LYISGIHSVLEQLKKQPNSIKKVFFLENKKNQQIEVLAQKNSIVIEYISVKKINTLSMTSAHQGVVALIKNIITRGEKELFSFIENKKNIFIATLENIQDPRNLGACFRSCYGADVDCVILTKNNTAPLNDLVYKTSVGAMSHLNIFQVSNLARVLKQLKNKGIWLIGLDGYAVENIYQNTMTASINIVVGSEGNGLKKQTKEICDELLSIPINPKLESLNVSVATAITLFEVRRQRLVK